MPCDLCLFMDDDLRRTKTFVSQCPHAETFSDVASTIDALDRYLLSNTTINRLFLDHDIQEQGMNSNRKDCGMEVVRWIVLNKPKIDVVFVHTHNQDASVVMSFRLRKAGYGIIQLAFSTLQTFELFDKDPSTIKSLKGPLK